MTEQEQNDYVAWEKNRMQSISTMIVEFFPSCMIFHTLIVSVCAVRSPTNFAVSAALFSMLMRIIMVAGYYMNKKLIYISASAMEIFINFMLLFIAMGYQPDAILDTTGMLEAS